MGIKDLWKELAPASRKESLHQMVLAAGYMSNSQGIRGYRVGIDASGWIYKQNYYPSQTKNAQLASLHANLNKIFNMTLLPVFVFDGASRPNIKRGKNVRGSAHWLENDFKEMLTAYGFPYHDAPAEAEAELSYLNRAGSIDAVWTEDSDVFVFGALCAFRILSEDQSTFTVTLYTAYNIEHHDTLGLVHDDLIFVALLAGGDYSDGLPQCGTKTAIQIARTGIGRALVAGVRSLSGQEALYFSRNWVNYFKQELQHNSARILPQKYPSLAAAIPSDFPDLTILNLYVKPLTSESTHAAPSFAWAAPDIGRLALFAEDNFVWGHLPGILNHFTNTIFSGLALRELIGATLQKDHQPNPFAHLIPLIDVTKPIISQRRSRSTGHMAELRIPLPIPRVLFNVIKDSLRGKYRTASRDAEADMWMTTRAHRV